MESKFLKTLLVGSGITGAFKLLYSILEKYGIGESEAKELGNEFETLSKEITDNIEKPNPSNISSSMFDRIYKPYKSV